MRHRLFSYNEISYRYQQPKDEFYYPKLRYQDDVNRQMSKDDDDLTDEERAKLDNAQSIWTRAQGVHAQKCMNTYKDLVDNYGVAREVARTILPVALMTEILVKGNARTWLHFLKLRVAKDAQSEIRDLADAIVKVIAPRIPSTWETFMNCDVNNTDIQGTWMDAIAEINDAGNYLINEVTGSLHYNSKMHFRDIIRRHGIIGKRKTKSFIELLVNMKILSSPLDENEMKIILTKPTE
jgi:thymidylate synthase ThyX